jgi:hypothetical protein
MAGKQCGEYRLRKGRDMIRVPEGGILAAFFVACIVLAGGAQAQRPCTPLGGYPYAQNSCIESQDINNAFELSIGPSPPQNAYGQGAHQGKLWLDTSVSPAMLRQCAVASPSSCRTSYFAADWISWMPVDLAGGQVNWPIGGGIATVPSAAVVDLGLYPQATLQITGTATINSFGATLPAGQGKLLSFSGSLQLINSNTLQLPGGQNITTRAGDIALVVSKGAGVFGVVLVENPVEFGTPASSSAACTQGQMEFDATYIYTCVATNTWHRASNGATW